MSESTQQEIRTDGVPETGAQRYERPRVADLGHVRDVVLGNAQDDTADMNTARYW